MRGPIRDISAARRDLIWPPEPRPISAPVRVRRAIRIRARRAPLRCLVHSPAGRQPRRETPLPDQRPLSGAPRRPL